MRVAVAKEWLFAMTYHEPGPLDQFHHAQLLIRRIIRAALLPLTTSRVPR